MENIQIVSIKMVKEKELEYGSISCYDTWY